MKPTKDQARELREEIGDRLVIASVSGGKDSAALSLFLTECEIPHDRVFADTGWESELTYKYLRGVLVDRLGPISEVRADRQMVDWIRHKGMFPSRKRRWCTDKLKVDPLFEFIFSMVASGREVVNAVGIRADESRARSNLPQWDGYSDKRGTFDIWRPLIDWTEEDVFAIHRRHDLAPNPLYFKGSRRVGCWPCIYSRKDEIKLIANEDPARIDLISELEAFATEKADARAAAKGKTNHHPRTFFMGQGPKDLFPRGRGAMPIADVVNWAKTGKGGRQFMLIDDPDPDAGCVRWGMCEHPSAKGDE